MCAYWDIPSMIQGAPLYHMSTDNRSQMHYHTARGEYVMGNFSLGRFPEMYITLEGTPFANCPSLLVVIAVLVVAGCVAPPLYVYRRKIYYKMVMVVYRRRKDKLARELKKRMRVYTEDMSIPLQSGDQRSSDGNMSCLICMDPLLDVRTTDLVILLDACGHRFHFQCILKWLDMSDGCPICRKTVDVNDHKALRLVYLDCRPVDGGSDGESEGRYQVDETSANLTSVSFNDSEIVSVAVGVPVEPVSRNTGSQTALLSPGNAASSHEMQKVVCDVVDANIPDDLAAAAQKRSASSQTVKSHASSEHVDVQITVYDVGNPSGASSQDVVTYAKPAVTSCSCSGDIHRLPPTTTSCDLTNSCAPSPHEGAIEAERVKLLTGVSNSNEHCTVSIPDCPSVTTV